jgi:hypothetical protein
MSATISLNYLRKEGPVNPVIIHEISRADAERELPQWVDRLSPLESKETRAIFEGLCGRYPWPVLQWMADVLGEASQECLADPGVVERLLNDHLTPNIQAQIDEWQLQRNVF